MFTAGGVSWYIKALDTPFLGMGLMREKNWLPAPTIM